MKTIEQSLKEIENKLTGSGVASARLDSLLILGHVLERQKSYLLAHTEELIPPTSQKTITSLVKRRIKREPLAYLLGQKEFYGLNFIVNKRVLIPRPETEAIVEHVITNASLDSSVLDVGTGSGCIAISVKTKRPDIKVEASDISDKALLVAANNQRIHAVDIKLRKSDLFKQITGEFNIIIANLPYVRLEAISIQPELRFEPALALFSDEEDGLNIYAEFFAQVGNYLAPSGQIIIEHEPAQLEKLNQLATSNQLRKQQSVSEFVTVFCR